MQYYMYTCTKHPHISKCYIRSDPQEMRMCMITIITIMRLSLHIYIYRALYFSQGFSLQHFSVHQLYTELPPVEDEPICELCKT